MDERMVPKITDNLTVYLMILQDNNKEIIMSTKKCYTLLVFCAGNSPDTGGFPSLRDSNAEIFRSHNVSRKQWRQSVEKDACEQVYLGVGIVVLWTLILL